jgi:DNA-binding MarR family transcriptional regulator
LHVQPPATDQLTVAELGAWRGLLRVHAALVRELDAELESAHGLPISSYDVLVHLEAASGGRMRMRHLADAVLLSRSGLSRLVDRLVRDGLIERAACPSDGRGAFAVLTERGRTKFAEARPTHLDGVRRGFLRHFSEDELVHLARGWDRILPGAGTPVTDP